MKTNRIPTNWKRGGALVPAALMLALGPESIAQSQPKTKEVAVILAAPPATPTSETVGLSSDTATVVRDAVSTAMHQAENAIQHAAHIGRSVAVAFAPGGTPRTLVLPGETLRAEDSDQVSEDLAVMSRILDRAVAKDGEEKGFYVALNGWNWKGRGGAEAFYLDGFGALFLLSVDFPLVGPAKESAAKEKERPKDTTWDDARRELQGGPPNWEAPFLGGSPDSATVEFDPDRVDELRDKVIDSLKHATNIRGLGDNDTLAVAVFGPSATLKERREVKVRSTAKGPPRTVTLATDANAGGSVMTLRVKKSDVEALAKGRIEAGSFAKRVAVSLR